MWEGAQDKESPATDLISPSLLEGEEMEGRDPVRVFCWGKEGRFTGEQRSLFGMGEQDFGQRS